MPETKLGEAFGIGAGHVSSVVGKTLVAVLNVFTNNYTVESNVSLVSVVCTICYRGD